MRKGKRRGRGKNSGGKGIRKRSMRQDHIWRSLTFEKTGVPFWKKLPEWPGAWLGRQRKGLEPLNLDKLRTFIEMGRLDSRFPITQRHLFECGISPVKRGVRIFNTLNKPFPYKIDIEVAAVDQSSIDAIKRVGGSITVVYMDRLAMRAHLKPYKFEILPRTSRPALDMVHYLEKMRARGANVRYIRPLWLLKEEQRLKSELAELDTEESLSSMATSSTKSSFVHTTRDLFNTIQKGSNNGVLQSLQSPEKIDLSFPDLSFEDDMATHAMEQRVILHRLRVAGKAKKGLAAVRVHRAEEGRLKPLPTPQSHWNNQRVINKNDHGMFGYSGKEYSDHTPVHPVDVYEVAKLEKQLDKNAKLRSEEMERRDMMRK